MPAIPYGMSVTNIKKAKDIKETKNAVPAKSGLSTKTLMKH